MKRMTPEELDRAAARLEEIGLEEETLRAKLLEQVEEFGFTPPRSDKSKRVEGEAYEFTVTRSVVTEIKDAAVQRIREVCSAALFDRLFKETVKFKLANGATSILAGRLPADAPKNLRVLFSRAVETKETSPRLRIEKVEVPASTS